MDRAEEFELLLDSCKNSVERFIYYKIPIKDDALDIMQETFISAYRKLDSLRDRDKFKPWLLSIARNKCNDYFRSRIHAFEIPLDETYGYTESKDKNGRAVEEVVDDTLLSLADSDRQILYLFYLKGMNQKDISSKLGIPIGTVKSRLNTARRNFKEKYPYPPNVKGDYIMSIKGFPHTIPEIKVTKIDKPIFPSIFEELPGWFIIPRVGEKVSWATYDYPEKTLSETENCEVIGKAEIHGINCVEIKCTERTLYARLTDTHVQYIADVYYRDDVKVMTSFLDENWLTSWSYGEDNCGRETQLNSDSKNISGVYLATIGGNSYEVVRLVDTNTEGIYTETYIDENGRTVLWRRFNRNDWAIDKYNTPWTEKLPKNERMTLNGETYIHWYDCITDYVL